MKKLLTALTLGVALAAAPAMGASAAAPSATATASPAGGVHPAVPSSTAARAVSDLTVTSPESGGTVPSRTFAITGTAPRGSHIVVTDEDRKTVAEAYTGTTAFSIPVSIPDTASWAQTLTISGRSGGRALTSTEILVFLDTPKTPTPTITSPMPDETVVGETQPFAEPGEDTAIRISGTGSPGGLVYLFAAAGVDPDSDLAGAALAEVESDGTWSARMHLGVGHSFLYAEEVSADDETKVAPSDVVGPQALTVVEPAGYIAPPVITKPSYDEEATAPSPSSVRRVEDRLSGSLRPERLEGVSAGRMLSALAGLPAAADSGASAVGASADSADTSAGTSAGASAAPSNFRAEAKADGGSSVDTPRETRAELEASLADYDLYVRDNGIPAVGRPSVSEPGKIDVEVSGTGTPGTGIALYAALPSVAFKYGAGLYPSWLAESGLPDLGVPASTLPPYDGRVTVGADGTWATTIAVAPGANSIEGFTVDASGPALRYSLAGASVDVTASVPVAVVTPPAVVAPVATPPVVAPGASASPVVSAAGGELASTGSDSRGPLLLGFGALAGGFVLVVAASRRRRRA